MSNILECRSLSFNYGDGNSKTTVLKNLDFRVKTEERIAIIGRWLGLNVSLLAKME